MPEARPHDDASTIAVEVHGDGPTVLLPVNPRPVEGPQAEELRRWGADPALGCSLIDGLTLVALLVVAVLLARDPTAEAGPAAGG